MREPTHHGIGVKVRRNQILWGTFFENEFRCPCADQAHERIKAEPAFSSCSSDRVSIFGLETDPNIDESGLFYRSRFSRWHRGLMYV
jgi:hypothetical protein